MLEMPRPVLTRATGPGCCVTFPEDEKEEASVSEHNLQALLLVQTLHHVLNTGSCHILYLRAW